MTIAIIMHNQTGVTVELYRIETKGKASESY